MPAGNQFKARLLWMDNAPLYAGRRYHFRGPVEGTALVTRIRHKVDPETQNHLAAKSIVNGETCEVELDISETMPPDTMQDNHQKAAFILFDQLKKTPVGRGTLIYEL